MTVNCSGKHKTRLIVGDGDFSYTCALLQKYKTFESLGSAITATELKLEGECLFAISNIEWLKSKGVSVEFGVDGTTLHLDERFRKKHFARIHWNCPHDGSDFKNQSLPPIIAAFFASCRHMQQSSDRVHITIPQPGDEDKQKFYQGHVYNLAQAAEAAGYRVIKKRKFASTRYPGYQHTQTQRNAKALVTDQGMREFVFEKVGDEVLHAIKEGAEEGTLLPVTRSSLKRCRVSTDNYYGNPRASFLCSSDDDSSDYGEKPEGLPSGF